jgi:outer membrane protein
MYLKKIILILFLFFSFGLSQPLLSDLPYYIDYKYILNQSTAGKKAQETLKNTLNKGITSIKDKEKKILEEEKKIIQQKKILSPEDYKKKITDLRKKVTALQSERNKLLDKTAKQRAKAKNTLLKTLNPIIKEHMASKNIKIIIAKKNLVMADESLDLTKVIVDLLNKKLKSINLN